MASDSALAQHWEKVVLLAAVVVLVGITFVSYGSYFSIKDPKSEIEKVGQKYRESVARPGVPLEPPERVGVPRFEQQIALQGDGTPGREWAFYNYMGVQFRRREEVVERRFRLPEVKLASRVDTATGSIEISLQPVDAEQGVAEIPQQGMFTVEFHRYELAAGSGSAEKVSTSNRFVTELLEEIGKAPAGSTATPLKSGRTYAYFVRMELGEDVLLVEGAARQAESSVAIVTTPDLFRIVGHRRERSKTFITVAVTDESASRFEVRVASRALKAGTPVETPKDQADTLGPYLPFRPQANSVFSTDFVHHDLQRSFFDMMFPQRTGAAGMGGGGGQQNPQDGDGDSGSGDEGTPPGEKTGGEKPEDGGSGGRGTFPGGR